MEKRTHIRLTHHDHKQVRSGERDAHPVADMKKRAHRVPTNAVGELQRNQGQQQPRHTWKQCRNRIEQSKNGNGNVDSEQVDCRGSDQSAERRRQGNPDHEESGHGQRAQVVEDLGICRDRVIGKKSGPREQIGRQECRPRGHTEALAPEPASKEQESGGRRESGGPHPRTTGETHQADQHDGSCAGSDHRKRLEMTEIRHPVRPQRIEVFPTCTSTIQVDGRRDECAGQEKQPVLVGQGWIPGEGDQTGQGDAQSRGVDKMNGHASEERFILVDDHLQKQSRLEQQHGRHQEPVKGKRIKGDQAGNGQGFGNERVGQINPTEAFTTTESCQEKHNTGSRQERQASQIAVSAVNADGDRKQRPVPQVDPGTA